jgi:hypothetical protein
MSTNIKLEVLKIFLFEFNWEKSPKVSPVESLPPPIDHTEEINYLQSEVDYLRSEIEILKLDLSSKSTEVIEEPKKTNLLDIFENKET